MKQPLDLRAIQWPGGAWGPTGHQQGGPLPVQWQKVAGIKDRERGIEKLDFTDYCLPLAYTGWSFI